LQLKAINVDQAAVLHRDGERARRDRQRYEQLRVVNVRLEDDVRYVVRRNVT
jgi:hypothetical protein